MSAIHNHRRVQLDRSKHHKGGAPTSQVYWPVTKQSVAQKSTSYYFVYLLPWSNTSLCTSKPKPSVHTNSCLQLRSQHSSLFCCTTYLAAPTPLLPTTSSLLASPLFLPSLLPTMLLPRDRPRLFDSDHVQSEATRHHIRTIKALFLNITYLFLTNQSNRLCRPSLDKLWCSSALPYYAGEHDLYTQSLI